MMPVSAKAAEDELEYRLLTYYAHEYGEDYRYYVESYPEITVKSGTTAKELGVDTEKTGLSVAERKRLSDGTSGKRIAVELFIMALPP